MPSVHPKTVSFYDRIAASYDEGVASEIAVRKAFRSLVTDTLPGSSSLLDFGCGTGLDAAHYADLGYRVYVWDPSPAMLDRTRENCRAHIASGSVTVLAQHHPGALPAKLAAVTANFAVTSLIPDLRTQFAEWAALLAANGLVFLSVQNLWYWRDVEQRWWWRGLPQSLIGGELRLRGNDTDLYRRRIAAITRAAQPHFELLRVAGPSLGKFRFLVYRRCQA